MKKFNTKYKNSFKIKKGFTLLETLIVVGVTIVIAGVGISSYVGQQRSRLLDDTAREIVGYLRYAQQKSIAQEDGNQWGVHFENPADGNDFYALYAGETYSSPMETKYLPAGITFQEPLSGNSIDMSYERLTGFLSEGSYQQVILQDVSENTENILTCKQGLIAFNRDISVCGDIDTTIPEIGEVIASNVVFGSYVSSPFTLSASVNEAEGGLLSCEYTINGGIDWYEAVKSGTGPSYTCTKTGITAADGTSLALNMRATSEGGLGTGTSISKTVDTIAPTCSDDWSDSSWASDNPIEITINCNDDRSGISSTKYCIDTVNSCSPSTSYTVPVEISCASGNDCTQYIRYYSKDNVNNTSINYSTRVRQDRKPPTDGTLTAEPDDQEISLSWSAASDSGSGLAAANTYKLVFSTSDFPDANCSSGSQIYLGTGNSYLHTGLTNDIPYYYRVCAYDAVGNISIGATDSGIPFYLIDDGEPCSLGEECLSGYCYIDEDGDRYSVASGNKKCQPNSQLSGTDCDDNNASIYPGIVVGTKDCDYLNYYYIYGTQSPTATSYCRYRNYVDQDKVCQTDGTISDPSCDSYGTSTYATCGTCEYVSACSSSSKTCGNYSGSSCGTCQWCIGSLCSSCTWVYQGNQDIRAYDYGSYTTCSYANQGKTVWSMSGGGCSSKAQEAYTSILYTPVNVNYYQCICQ